MIEKTDIFLTHGYFLEEDEKEKKIMRPYPPLGLLYVSAFLKESNLEVYVFDSTFYNTETWKTEIRLKSPKIVAFYTNLMTKVKVLELVQYVKKIFPDTLVIAGGPDVTYNIENYLQHGFDYIVTGEGELTMYELCKALLTNQSVSNIAGISYKLGHETIQNPAREKLKEIKELPFPDRASIPLENYLKCWSEHHGKRTLNISTQRGCPYTCKWCSTAVYGQSYRRNAPARVVEEILELKLKFNAEALWFVDDVFTVSHKWITELHVEFQKNHLIIPFECITRAERLNDEILQMLKEMGCFRIWIGAESGSQKVIDLMDRRVDLTTVSNMIQRTQFFGMEAGTFIMVGYPGETMKDIKLTRKYLEESNPNLLTITRAYPIKGTGLYDSVSNKLTHQPIWSTSTDRDIRFKMPYSDRFYRNSIRYLMNAWLAKRNKPNKFKLKQFLALLLMHVRR